MSTRRGWNEERIRELVLEEDVETILSIKLCHQATKDVLGWHYTKDGGYTVKSAYWLANQVLTNQHFQPPPGDVSLKAAIWKFNTAPKIHHFLWKIASGSLPTGTNLRRRHISRQSICRCCCITEESEKHLFFYCFYAQHIWRASGFSHPALFDIHTSLENKLQLLLSPLVSRHNPQIQQVAIWVLWRIWKSRNQLVFQQKNRSWQNALTMAKRDATEWLTSRDYIYSLTPTHTRLNNRYCRPAQPRWEKPPRGWIKCNFDGSFYNRYQPTKAGWIIRDDTGVFKEARQAIGTRLSSAFECEFQALIMAMQHLWSKGYRRVIFEGDCKEMIDILNEKKLNFGCYNWTREARVWKDHFENVQYKWTPRENNQPTDILAKKDIPDNKLFHFHYFAPLYISNSLHCNHIQV